MPQHANTLQITFGGQIIQWMETCALVSARRLACTYLMTASIDSLQFIKPTHVGEVVTVRGIVSRTFKSSIEVYVSVEVGFTFPKLKDIFCWETVLE
jgi:acyl-CoA hydrolase